MGGEKTQRKFKILATVLICAFAISIVFASDPAVPNVIATWTGQSIVSLTSSPATDTFTTTVAGADTNAVNSPITLAVGAYTSSYTSSDITNFNPPAVAGDPNNPSQVDLSASGFVPGEWAAISVTITNTGSAALTFVNPVLVTDEFNAAGGSYTFPSPYTEGTIGPHSYTDTFDFNPTTGFDYGATVNGFGTSTFAGYLSGAFTNTWCQDNVIIGANTLPTVVLTTGQSFTYYIYTGLGLTPPYGIPGSIYTITLNLTPVP